MTHQCQDCSRVVCRKAGVKRCQVCHLRFLREIRRRRRAQRARVHRANTYAARAWVKRGDVAA